MDDLQNRFAAAQATVKDLDTRPDNGTLLKLYALYKQASVGEVCGRRPGFSDPVGRAKYDAWVALQGTSVESAMAQYIALVDTLHSA